MNHQRLVGEIVLKYHRGEPLTAEEQAILDAELARLPTDRVWEKIRARIENKPVLLIRPWYSRWPAVTAGAAAVLSLIAWGLYRYSDHAANGPGTLAVQTVWRTVAPGHFYEELAGPEGVIVVDSAAGGQSDPYPVTLPDGSKVTLSYGSSVRYAKGFEKRKVVLAGQAHFDVVKAKNPFIVESGNVTVEVLGTQFNWMHYPGVPDEITLLSGKIVFERGNLRRELAPAERAVIREGNPARVNVRKMEQPENSVAWMGARREIEFDGEDLDVVIQRMAQYYQVGYRIDKGLRIARPVRVTVKLQWSLEENLAAMRKFMGDYARVELKKGIIEITN